MKKDIFSSVIDLTGSEIPTKVIPNSYFIGNIFYAPDGTPLSPANELNLLKFEEISLIGSRRYVEDNQTSSDIGYLAAKKAYNPKLKYGCFVVARNSEELALGQLCNIDIVPSHASRVKHKFDIKTLCPAYDIILTHRNLQKYKDYMAFGATDLVLDVMGFNQTGLYESAKSELLNLGIDAESLTSIVVIHIVDANDCLADKIANKLGIDYELLTYDIIFGCPGFVQAFIQVDSFIRSGRIKLGMVGGVETLSRLRDPFDRNSPLYADGAAFWRLKRVVNKPKVGVLTSVVRSHIMSDLNVASYLKADSKFLWMGPSQNPNFQGSFLNMDADKVFKYALNEVPEAIKEALDNAGISLNQVAKIIVHQANGRIIYSIIARVCKLFGYDKSELGDLLPKKHSDAIVGELINKYGIRDIPPGIAPITVDWLANPSVASIGTAFDLIRRGKLKGHSFKSGDIIVLPAVGAGPAENVAVMRLP